MVPRSTEVVERNAARSAGGAAYAGTPGGHVRMMPRSPSDTQCYFTFTAVCVRANCEPTVREEELHCCIFHSTVSAHPPLGATNQVQHLLHTLLRVCPSLSSWSSLASNASARCISRSRFEDVCVCGCDDLAMTAMTYNFFSAPYFAWQKNKHIYVRYKACGAIGEIAVCLNRSTLRLPS